MPTYSFWLLNVQRKVTILLREFRISVFRIAWDSKNDPCWKSISCSPLAHIAVTLGSFCSQSLSFLSYQVGVGMKELPRCKVVKNPPASAGDTIDVGLIPGLERSPGGWNSEPTSVFLPGESHGQRSLAGYSPWGHEESDITEWLSMQKWGSYKDITKFLVIWSRTDGIYKWWFLCLTWRGQLYGS